MSSYTNLIGYMLSKANRDKIQSMLSNLTLDTPYDEIVAKMMICPVDLTSQDLIAMLSDTVPSALLNTFTKIQPVSDAVGLTALADIEASTKLTKIGNILKNKSNPHQKLLELSQFAHNGNNKYTLQSKAKLTSELSDDTSTLDIIDICNYSASKGELVLLCAFPGMGKTTMLLAITRDCVNRGLKPLYISIHDFTEAQLKRKLSQAKEMPEFHCAVYSQASIQQIEIDVNAVKPDVLLVDYAMVMDAPKQDQKRGELEANVRELKRVASDSNILVISAWQLNRLSEYPVTQDLLELKSATLAHVDLCLAFGGQMHTWERNCVTFKARRWQTLDVQTVYVDFANLYYETM